MFPQKTFFGKKGWKDLGEVEDNRQNGKDGKIELKWESCGYCYQRVHIGSEDGKLFKFCSRCLVKLNDKIVV